MVDFDISVGGYGLSLREAFETYPESRPLMWAMLRKDRSLATVSKLSGVSLKRLILIEAGVAGPTRDQLLALEKIYGTVPGRLEEAFGYSPLNSQ